MIKYTAFVLLVLFRIFYHPSSAPAAMEPLSKPLMVPATQAENTPAKPGKKLNQAGQDKLAFKWIWIQNETETKLCSVTNLAFGIEKPESGYSLFLNHTVIQKMFFHIGLVNKSRATTC